MSPLFLPKLRRFGCMIILFCLASTFSSTLLAMSNPCDPAQVSVDANGWFVVSASGDMTGVTDTTNLNCTTNAIENQSFEKVRLKNGDFHISEVALNCPPSKNCLLSGTTKAGTVVNIVDGSIECNAQWLNRIATAGITVRGSATVRYMTLMANEPCATEDGFLPSVIQFTGAPAIEAISCDNATSFSIFDRVDITTTGDEIDVGLFVGPQSEFFHDTCPYLLTGTFNGVRNSIDGPYVCAQIEMQGRARVGMDFFVARNCHRGIATYNAGQSMRITRADILVDATIDNDNLVAGVLAIRDPGGPDTSSLSIDRSTIEVRSGAESPEALGVYVEDYLPSNVVKSTAKGNTIQASGSYPNADDGSLTNIDVSVTNTSFELDGPNTTVARFMNIDNGTFSANEMYGNGLAGFEILVPLVDVVKTQAGGSSGIEQAQEGTRAIGWSVLFNYFGEPEPIFVKSDEGQNGTESSPGSGVEEYTVNFDHIFGGAGTEDNVFGLHEGAIVADVGCNFDLNVADGGCALNPILLSQKSGSGLKASTVRPSYGRHENTASSGSFRRARPGFRD